MLRKDVRSIVMSLLLGDGCIHVDKRGYGYLKLCHGSKQRDYIQWKARLLSGMYDRDVKCLPCKDGRAYQIQLSNNRFKAWYKFVYKNKMKDITLALRYIRHPELAIAIWLMDDGYVEPSISRLANGEKRLYGARFRLFTCSFPDERQHEIISWLQDNLDINSKVHYQKRGKTSYVPEGKPYPFLKFNSSDSLKLWVIIREFVLQFDSMKYKFRHIEEIYQRKLAQRMAP